MTAFQYAYQYGLYEANKLFELFSVCIDLSEAIYWLLWLLSVLIICRELASPWTKFQK